MLRTFVHELGHHIHLHDQPVRGGRASQLSQRVDAIVGVAFVRSRGPITMYGQQSAREFFAESFAAYMFERAALQQHDPVAFKMVVDVLAARGLTVR